MKRLMWALCFLFTIHSVWGNYHLNKLQKYSSPNNANGFTNAADFGFLPSESGINNTKALQAAVDKGGTIIISNAGTYKLAGTVYIGDSTSLIFGDGTTIQKVAEKGAFCQVFLNKGALSRTYNYHISIVGLNLQVNAVEKGWDDAIYGLRGQVAFFYAKDVKIERFRCNDLGTKQFCLHFCTFEDLLINDVIIKGKKDGIHFGKGKRFKISNAQFQTADDAIALAAGDWVTANPEFGDIEDGIIENCYDLRTEHWDGAFAKIVASGWTDWKEGIEVKHGDAVVADGKIYRVLAQIDGKKYKSVTKPTFDSGIKELDGIKWTFHQSDTIHTAVVRKVVFRDIFLESMRVPFQIMCYDINYAHSYYSGAPMPVQGEISLENVTVVSDNKKALVNISTPIDILTIRNSTLKNNSIDFRHAKDFDTYPETHISLSNCIYKSSGVFTLIKNNSKGKEIFLKTNGSIELGKSFSVKVEPGLGTIHIDSDLTGLKK
ncbi:MULTISPECIES: hypothetical protein [unclassified Arcicella]|uniref:hypothetical protein n=1 Tax=unclassified Arcicella TaxID=2644986 RepID=UPI00285A9F25|nr:MULTISPECIES: hypothetical protein [unclassified Arcicella]MDR6562305.1 hypothetical protein [Arcicella sp. BE51]MDR6812000.1 hypothetical protein [Arcicella sp. BE140]MDR6823311.1 hypothetical protein [Arcicella sp. BE139]